MGKDSLINVLFSLEGQVAVVTGGTGVLGGAMARGLARAGAKVGILGRRREQAEAVAAEIIEAGGEAIALPADVLDQAQLETARQKVLETWGKIDILVNAAGGNVPAATLSPDKTFFDLPIEAFGQVFDLNLQGTILPTQVFGAAMVRSQPGETPRGCVINISSMAAIRVISRVVGYSAAKAAIDNFTRWLAVELAQKYGSGLRVNAIAPGFFVGDQNRALLLNSDGTLTPRGQSIVTHTPAGRFGTPDELLLSMGWSCRWTAVLPLQAGFKKFIGRPNKIT